MDLYPTILQLAGLPLDPVQHRDGTSLVGLLNGQEDLERDRIFWHFPHYHGSGWTPGSAIRQGRWKLIEFYHWNKVELYDLESDLGEGINLAMEMPEKTAELLTILHDELELRGAQSPVNNPAYVENQ
jgi:arylsulfatase A-like enzyme